jgi:hypothetical protein
VLIRTADACDAHMWSDRRYLRSKNRGVLSLSVSPAQMANADR